MQVPRTLDYSHYLNVVAKKRKPSAIRALQPLLQQPGMISLGGGMPHPSTFPFSRLSFEMRTSGKMVHLSEEETAKALQYSLTSGIPEFIQTLRSLQHQEHRPPLDTFDMCVTNGSQDGISKVLDLIMTTQEAFEMVVSPGDSILIEKPCYSGTLSILKPMVDCSLVGVETDKHGLVPESLENILNEWNQAKEKPKVLYTVSTASNPSGCTTSFERKQIIYKIAQKHNLLIFEDDPYYYLQFSTPRVKSYFSLDIDGRVLRFDSFSKILSSGMRLGVVTGPKELVNPIILHSQCSNLHANGISQMLAWKLFQEWGIDGFMKHVDEVSEFYKKRRDFTIECMEKYLVKAGNSSVKWNIPDGGMFIWMKLEGVEDTRQLIKEHAVEKKILFLPGGEFMPPGNDEKCSFVRAAFSTATLEDIEEAIKRLAALI